MPGAAGGRGICGGLLVAVLALAAGGCQARPEVLLIGVDGASWKVIGPMIEAGELPTLAGLQRQGATMQRFDTLESTISPVIWTTVATGRSPEDHGVESFVSRLPDGSQVPVSGSTRRVPALWNILTEYGRQVGVIGWWASWPAEPVDGYVVSDHANPATVDWMVQDRITTFRDVRPEELSSSLPEVMPPELAAGLDPFWFPLDPYPMDEVEAYAGLTPEQLAVLEHTPPHRRSTYGWFKTFFAVDLPLARVARWLRQERPVDLQMLYLRGPDPVQHYAWDLVEPEAFASRRPTFERDQGIVEATYRYVDRALGELLTEVGEDTWVILCSDHGAEPSARAGRPGGGGRPGRHTSAAKGVLFIAGPGVRAGHPISAANPYDVAPTVLWLLGLPLAAELEGSPIFEAFDESFVADRPVRQVDRYAPRPVPVRVERQASGDDVRLDQLRSLGYLD